MEFVETAEHVYLRTPYEQREYVKEVLNGEWSQKYKAYRFPKTYHALRELLLQFPNLQFNKPFVELGRRLNLARQQFAARKSLPDASGDHRLRSYQRVDVQYLKALPAAGVFNEQRTGKTPTIIAVLKELDLQQTLIIAPASLVYNWKAELSKWWPDAKATVITGTPKQREALYQSDGIWIISKDTLKLDIDRFAKLLFDACVVDEAHFLRNLKTAQTKAVHKIKAERRYALTGTPTVKHPADAFGILKFLYPQKFTSYWQFVERYFDTYQDFMGHEQIGSVKENRKEELQELIGFVSVQRKRSEVMQWLPAKQYQELPCRMDRSQQKLYDDMARWFEATDEDSSVDAPSVLAQLTRLRQLCLDPALLGFKAKSAKTEALLEWLDNNREPTVVMSMFTSYLKHLKPLIEKMGLKVGEINGELSNRDKQQAVERFQTGRVDVLLCNTISAGVGFTLDRAETVIFTDRPWDSATAAQAEDRIVPVSEERNHSVTVLSLYCAGSVDEHIDRLVKHKKSLTDLVNEGGIAAIRRLLGWSN